METYELSISLPAVKAVIAAANLPSVERPTCEYYQLAFESLKPTSHPEHEACGFMIRLCAMRLVDDSPDSTFGLPGTSWTENEFTDDQLAVLSELGESIEDDELKARVCDLVWIRLRRPAYARTAAKSYIGSGEKIAANNDFEAGWRLARGIRLAFTIDKRGDLPDELVNRARTLLEQPSLADFVVADAVEQLLPTGAADCDEFMVVCERRALSAEKPLAQQRFYDLAFRIAQRTKSLPSAEKFLGLLAKSHEHEADSAPAAVLAVHSLKQAIHILRRGPGTSQEQKRLHTKLLEFQSNLPAEFTPIDTGSIDLTEIVEQARKRLRGKDKLASLAELVLASQVPDMKRLRKNARQSILDFPLQNIFATEKFGSTYKTATAIPATDMSGDIPEERLQYSMLTEYNCLFGIVAHGTIQPMLESLNYSHHITMSDLSWLVR